MSIGYTNTRINCSDATITNAPVNPTDGANKAYVDLIAAGFNFINSCFVSSTADLNAIYNNGAAGIGATLTNNGALAAFTSDGVSPALNARVLVKNQTNQFENGVYDLTTVGDGVTAWVLTRSTDYDEPAQVLPGDIVPVLNGTLYHDTFWAQTDTVTTIGVDAIIFVEFNSDNLPVLTNGQLFIGSTGNPPQAASLTAGSNIQITPGPGSITIAATPESGSAVQFQYSQTNAQLSSLVSAANNPPQITDGTQLATITLTPQTIGNTLYISSNANLTATRTGSSANIYLALYRNGGAACISQVIYSVNNIIPFLMGPITLDYLDTAAAAVPVTYEIRFGYFGSTAAPGAVVNPTNFYVSPNGYSGMRITEYQV